MFGQRVSEAPVHGCWLWEGGRLNCWTENSAYQIKRCNGIGTKLKPQCGSRWLRLIFMLCAGEVILCANLRSSDYWSLVRCLFYVASLFPLLHMT